MISAELYETDFYEWTQHNAELLRSGNIQEADLTHVAEELEDMGMQERRDLLVAYCLLNGASAEMAGTTRAAFPKLGSNDTYPAP